MKALMLLLIIFNLATWCKGQSVNMYSARAEYGLRGNVKQMTSYFCEMQDNQKPIDTSKYVVKSTITFDKMGNAISLIKIYNLEGIGRIGYIIKFSGTGKNISYIDSSLFENSQTIKNKFKYVWSDNYNYTIIPEDKGVMSINVKLDKNYRHIENITNLNDRKIKEKFDIFIKNDRVEKIINKTTESKKGELVENVLIHIVRAYDNYGNPAVIYVANQTNEQKIKQIIYKNYQYF